MSLIFPLICLSHNLKLSMFLNMTHLMFLIECFFNCSTHFFQTRHQTRDRSGRHGTVRYGMPATLTIRVTSSTLYLPPNTILSFYPDLERRTDGRTFKHGDKDDELYVANTTQRSMVVYKQNTMQHMLCHKPTRASTQHTATTYWSEGLHKRVKVLACAKVKIPVLVRNSRLTNLYA